jgi:hypothetical protein
MIQKKKEYVKVTWDILYSTRERYSVQINMPWVDATFWTCDNRQSHEGVKPTWRITFSIIMSLICSTNIKLGGSTGGLVLQTRQLDLQELRICFELSSQPFKE